MDCSTLDSFQNDLDSFLSSIEGVSGHLIIVATSLGCIHAIKLANRVVKQCSLSTTVVFCAVPSLVTYQWQTTMLCIMLKYINFLKILPFPKWVARKIWTTTAHRENISLLSVLPSDQEILSEQVRSHIIFTVGDFLSGSKKQQEKWVDARSESSLKSNITLFTHYPYIFDRKRFWNYLQSLDVNNV